MLNQPVLEKKYFNQFKKLDTNDSIIKGYASVFNVIDSHNDLIMPQAFNESIIKHHNLSTVKLLWQHNHQEPIGSIDNLVTDNIGLIMSAKISQYTQRGREVMALIQQRAIDGLSIGFRVVEHHYNQDNIRIITKADLWEISVVTFPANEQAQLSLQNNKNTALAVSLNKALYNITKLNNL